MKASGLIGILMSAAVVLATIYVFNRFSKSGGVAALGVQAAK